jgi:hypothetical protein
VSRNIHVPFFIVTDVRFIVRDGSLIFNLMIPQCYKLVSVSYCLILALFAAFGEL